MLTGSGIFTLAGQPDVVSSDGTILVTPARVSHGPKAEPQARCEALNCVPLGPDWQVHRAGHGGNRVIVACSSPPAC